MITHLASLELECAPIGCGLRVSRYSRVGKYYGHVRVQCKADFKIQIIIGYGGQSCIKFVFHIYSPTQRYKHDCCSNVLVF